VSTFLLEIGTEELPADFSRLVGGQLELRVAKDFEDRRLEYGSIYSTTTPRRVVLLVNDLADKASDFEELRKGPAYNNAFVNGSPTNAAIGFAKSLSISVKDLAVRETQKGSFVFGKKVELGESSLEILKQLIPGWLSALQGKRFMRWGSKDRRFARPIRWIVALLDDELIPLIIRDTDPEVTTTRLSRGHRLFSSEVSISSASSYCSDLQKFGVAVDRNKRLSLIEALINDASDSMNALPDISNELLNELTDLVELPSLIIGEIDDSFLELPPEVLTTVMKVHQRYIPLYKNNYKRNSLSLNSRNILLPRFLCICNSIEDSKEKVKIGNERVLRARLSDADFFMKIDLSNSSLERADLLRNVIFAKGLGSLFDRVSRITWVVKFLTKELALNPEDEKLALLSAELSKNDLTSQMVGEFPELQGLMGAKYLVSEGQSQKISIALLEQYLPKYSGGELPQSPIGSILAIADRIELIISIFAKGERPSGSSDPYALRRAANGILNILWARNWSINILRLIELSIDHWVTILPDLAINKSSLIDEIFAFLRLRIIGVLEELLIDQDIVQAVAGEGNPINKLLLDPNDVKIRADLLSNMRNNCKLSKLQKTVNRASSISFKCDLELDILSPVNIIDESLFESECEFKLLEMIRSIEPIVIDSGTKRYSKLVEKLVCASEVLEDFFDGPKSIMVMVDDENIRNNRLKLLAILRNQALQLCDFTRINP